MLKADEETVAQVGESLQKMSKDVFEKYSYIPDMLPRLWKQYDKTVCDNCFIADTQTDIFGRTTAL
jgi:mannose-6-phosphate isomerase